MKRTGTEAAPGTIVPPTRYRFSEVRSALREHWGLALYRGGEGGGGDGEHDGRWDVTCSRTGFVVYGDLPGRGHRGIREPAARPAAPRLAARPPAALPPGPRLLARRPAHGARHAVAARVRPVTYSWAIDATLGRPEVREVSGAERTLRAAKRRVEAVFRRLYSWRFPASRGY